MNNRIAMKNPTPMCSVNYKNDFGSVTLELVGPVLTIKQWDRAVMRYFDADLGHDLDLAEQVAVITDNYRIGCSFEFTKGSDGLPDYEHGKLTGRAMLYWVHSTTTIQRCVAKDLVYLGEESAQDQLELYAKRSSGYGMIGGY